MPAPWRPPSRPRPTRRRFASRPHRTARRYSGFSTSSHWPSSGPLTRRSEMSNNPMLAGKVVIVTGAGGGIGRDIALAMARDGAKVVVNDVGASMTGEGHDVGPAQRVVDEIRAAGGTAVANTDSVADATAADRIVTTALDTYGRLDAVVNNAGILRDRFFHKMSVEEFDSVIKVHLYGS